MLEMEEKLVGTDEYMELGDIAMMCGHMSSTSPKTTCETTRG